MVDEQPTTGSPVLDELIRTHFTEAIGVVRQILVDRHPEVPAVMRPQSEAYIGQTCAILCTQLWPIFGALFVEGADANLAGLIGGEDGG